MIVSLYLTILPLVIVCIYVFVKYIMHRKVLESGELVSDLHNFEDAKEIVFNFVDEANVLIQRNFKILLHWVLHLFVIILGIISDLTDILYAKARDFFLKTATKEKDVVTTFWHHLKDYKKEKEEEKQN